MTLKQALARTLPAAAFMAAVILSLPGCEGGATTGTDQSKVSAERQAELDKQKEATEAFYKEQAKKK